MNYRLTRDGRILEIMLIIVVLGTTTLFVAMGAYRMVVLNLFYVPIILSGYFLGRTSAGVLALFCALTVTIAATVAPARLVAFGTPIMLGLALTMWAAVLGLCALLMGTLCDQRAATVSELHRAYVGVVEVLSKYLQGGNPHVKGRSVRVAELSQMVAEELRLSRKEIDDIRVAALLHELGSVEITTQMISRAVDTLEAGPRKHTFAGIELVQSLGSVLEGALPLLVNQDDAARDYLTQANNKTQLGGPPLGARIIRTARAYDDLTAGAGGEPSHAPEQALELLRADAESGYDADVLDALARVGRRSNRTVKLEPAFR